MHLRPRASTRRQPGGEQVKRTLTGDSEWPSLFTVVPGGTPYLSVEKALGHGRSQMVASISGDQLRALRDSITKTLRESRNIKEAKHD